MRTILQKPKGWEIYPISSAREIMIQAEIQEQRIQLKDIALNVAFAGPKDGEKLILLHGFPEYWYGWRNQIDFLVEAGYRLIMPDQRGYNKSDKPKGVRNYGIARLGEDILQLMDHCELREATIIAHDWGAIISWWLSLTQPDRIKRQVVMNVPHPVVMQRFLLSNWQQMRKSWYVFFFQLPWLPEFGFKQQNGHTMSKKLRKTGLPNTFSDDDLEKYRTAWEQPGAVTAMINWYRGTLWAKPKTPKNQTIDVPTLLLWGMKDIALSHHMAQPSIDLCSQGELQFFENATHWVQHDAAGEVNRHILEFLG